MQRLWSLEMKSAMHVQIPDEVVCAFFDTKALGKGLDPLLHSAVLEKAKQGSLALVRQLVWEKENSEFKPAVACSKIDLVSHPACGGGVG